MFIIEALTDCGTANVVDVTSENLLQMNLHISENIGFDFLVF